MYSIKPVENIKIQVKIPPDKSIFHRAVIISSLSLGKTQIEPLLLSEDSRATLGCVEQCGIKIERKGQFLNIDGNGIYFPVKNKKITLCAGESGTTIRILSGALCGQKFSTIFTASGGLNKRPMGRITKPLRTMNAQITGRVINGEEYPPLLISPVTSIHAIKYILPVASAQVKSAILFASLYSSGITQIKEPFVSRDHTERMFSVFGLKLNQRKKVLSLESGKKLVSPGRLFIPSDFSSAAFFIVLGLILKNSQILIKDVNVNPTRCGLLTVLRRMGAKIKLINKRDDYEPYADILVKSSKLKACAVSEKEIPLIIDEVPVFCVAAAFAVGRTSIWGVKELKVKETDRIKAIVYNLRKAGISISAKEYSKRGEKNWMITIDGNKKLNRADFKSFSDHRISMSMAVLGKALEEASTLDDIECINKSFPEFISLMKLFS